MYKMFLQRIYMSGLNLADIISLANSNGSDSYHEIASRLKFIGKIQKGDKVNTRYMYVQPDTWYTRLIRTVWGSTDNRKTTYEFIEFTVKLGFLILQSDSKTDDFTKQCEKSVLNSIADDLRGACTGMENLKTTYADDLMFCCKIETLIQGVKSRLAESGISS